MSRPEAEDAISQAVLATVLEAIPAAAFVFEAPAEIVVANALGRNLEDADPVGVRRHLRQLAATGSADAYDVSLSPVTVAGRTLLLAVQRSASPAVTRSLARAFVWKLSPNEHSVLALIVEGKTNIQMAARLGCSVKTIEMRVTTILRKSRHRKRTTLLAELLK